MDIESTGFRQEIDDWQINKIPPYDPRSGKHYWTLFMAYEVKPDKWVSNHTPIFDKENLKLVTGPGCFYCEQPYSKYLAMRRCKGQV